MSDTNTPSVKPANDNDAHKAGDYTPPRSRDDIQLNLVIRVMEGATSFLRGRRPRPRGRGEDR